MGRHREAVVTSLRSMIVGGELKPGEIFSEKEIAERFDVSRTPVREAVAILVREDLLDQIPQVGVTVHVFSEEEIDDLLNTRHMIETHVTARLADRPATSEDLEALADLMETMRAAATARDRLGFLEADAAFHAEIARRAGFALAAQLIGALSDKIRVVGLDALHRDDGMDQVLAEHQAILDAIATHDSVGASKAMDAHLQKTRNRLEQSRLKRN